MNASKLDGRYRSPWLCLALLCAMLAACGPEENAPQPTPPPTPQPTWHPTPQPRDTRWVRSALRNLDASSREERARAIQTLRDERYDEEEIFHLVIPRAHDDGDQVHPALADLLSSEAETFLPRLLHRVTHASPVQRARICRALGTPRENVAPASALLVVRALLDPFTDVRTCALAALQQIDPEAASAAEEHSERHGTLADGSAQRLDASLLIDAGCPYASEASEALLRLALRAEGARFGFDTTLRLAAFVASIPDGEVWSRELILSLVGNDRSRSAEAVWLTGVAIALYGGTWNAQIERDLLPLLEDEDKGAYTAWVLGEMGAESPAAIDALVQRLVRRVLAKQGAEQSEGALMRLVARGHGFEPVAALLSHDRGGVARTALRILALCAEEDRARAEAAIRAASTTATSRTVRRAARYALVSLAAPEAERARERADRIAELTAELPDP